MKYLGDLVPGQLLMFCFSTQQLGGAPITLGGSPAVGVYKSDSSDESTDGVTLSTDYDGRTGLHLVKIDTDHAFYEEGADYSIVLTAGQVDGVSVVGRVLGAFSIANRSAQLTDDSIEGIGAQIAASLTGVEVTVASPLNPATQIVSLVCGDSYNPETGAASRKIVWTIEGLDRDYTIEDVFCRIRGTEYPVSCDGDIGSQKFTLALSSENTAEIGAGRFGYSLLVYDEDDGTPPERNQRVSFLSGVLQVESLKGG